MERIKKKKIQEMLDSQNAAIDADMVSHSEYLLLDLLCSVLVKSLFNADVSVAGQQGKGATEVSLAAN